MTFWVRVGPDWQVKLHEEKPSLEQLQRAVAANGQDEALIEVVPRRLVPLPCNIIVNEQPVGDEQRNATVDQLTGIPVRGTAIFIGPGDDDGEFTALPGTIKDWLLASARLRDMIRDHTGE